jgi:phage terminase Nu1 subunit (DNA packaging protein)
MSNGLFVSKGDLATTLGVAINTVTGWVRRGCPYVEKGGKSKPWIFNTADVVKWREEMAAQAAVGDTSKLDIEEARRRKEAAQAAMIELDLAKRRGEVVEIEEVADAVGDDYANLRAKLLSLPTKLAPQVAGLEDLAKCKAIIEKGVHDALEELVVDGLYAGTD